MPDYTELTDAALAANKPVTQSMLRALRDNLLAVIGAGSGAPPVEMKALEQLFFSARRTSSSLQNITNNQDVVFGTEELDPSNCYNHSTGRFTPTKAGVYRVCSRLTCSSGSNSVSTVLRLYKNASALREVFITTTGTVDVIINTLVELNGSTDELFLGFSGILNVGSGIYGGDFSAELVKGA